MPSSFQGWEGWGDSWGPVTVDPNAMFGSASFAITATGNLTNGTPSTVDVRVSWLEVDTDATPVDVRVSWLEVDTSAVAVDVRVSWLALDTAAQGTGLQYWTGTTWLTKPLFRWNGVTWVSAIIKRNNGVAWI